MGALLSEQKSQKAASHPGTVKSPVYETTAKAGPVGLVIM